MFKKLKDKIAEEVKQSPLRLPTSVQQHLSQVVILYRILSVHYHKSFYCYGLLMIKSVFLLSNLEVFNVQAIFCGCGAWKNKLLIMLLCAFTLFSFTTFSTLLSLGKHIMVMSQKPNRSKVAWGRMLKLKELMR